MLILLTVVVADHFSVFPGRGLDVMIHIHQRVVMCFAEIIYSL